MNPMKAFKLITKSRSVQMDKTMRRCPELNPKAKCFYFID